MNKQGANMQFKELNVIPTILKALEKENYAEPTPIQEKAIPLILSGRDLLGCAQTGTGKTAAFAIPTLQLLSKEKVPDTADRNIRALIVTPTRELALQIYDSFCTYGKYTKLRYCAIFGGVSQKPQEEKLQQGVDILVATPGRLNDLINQKRIDLKYIEIFILDEADRMLDMGFINDVKKIITNLPVKKQTLLFSATMPPDIAALSNTMLKNPAKIEISPVSSTVDTIEQYLYYVDKNNKKDLLLHILKDKSIVSALVFTRTKHGADRIVKQLSKEKVTAQAIHGDKSQGARQNALNNFKSKKLRILIATDIAARGIDIDELSHVINYDLPDIPETYVHRIGRTGRAGLGGVAISFCDFDEKEQLTAIENLIGKHLIEVKDHPFPLMNNFPAIKATQPRRNASRTASPQPASTQAGTLKTSPSQRKMQTQTASHQTASRVAASPNKKYRMTADGTLKEKRSFMKFSKKGKKGTDYSKKKNNREQ
jgi:ATP-dependent RNA helicase RhlE